MTLIEPFRAVIALALVGDPVGNLIAGLGFRAVASIVAWVLLEAGRG